MRGVNKVIIVGTLGNDPEVKQFPNGGSITNISVATSEQWNDKQTGEKREATEWHRITFNNKLAEIAAQYLRKGSQVYVEGSLRTRKYQDQNGQDRYTTDIRADQMQMLGGRPAGQGDYNNQNGGWNNANNQGGYPQNNQGGYNNNNNNGYNPNQNYSNQGNNAPSNNNFGGQGSQGGQGNYDNAQAGPNPFMANNQPPAQIATNAPIATPKPGVVDDDVPFAQLPF